MRRKSSALLTSFLVVAAALGTTPGAIADSTASVDVAFTMANLFSIAQWLMLNYSLPAGTSLDTREAKAKDNGRCRSVSAAVLVRGESIGCSTRRRGPEGRAAANAVTWPARVNHARDKVRLADKGKAKRESSGKITGTSEQPAEISEQTTTTPTQVDRSTRSGPEFPGANAAWGRVSAKTCSICNCVNWGGGYVHSGCYWTCGLVCLLSTGGSRYYNAACLIACRGACYVPRYCETYQCETSLPSPFPVARRVSLPEQDGGVVMVLGCLVCGAPVPSN